MPETKLTKRKHHSKEEEERAIEEMRRKRKEKKRLEGYLVAIDKEGKPLPNQPEEVPSDVSLSDEELEEQFQALSPSDKLRYNQWCAFHHEYQH